MYSTIIGVRTLRLDWAESQLANNDWPEIVEYLHAGRRFAPYLCSDDNVKIYINI